MIEKHIVVRALGDFGQSVEVDAIDCLPVAPIIGSQIVYVGIIGVFALISYYKRRSAKVVCFDTSKYHAWNKQKY